MALGELDGRAALLLALEYGRAIVCMGPVRAVVLRCGVLPLLVALDTQREAPRYFVGTSCFNSSIQFCTTTKAGGAEVSLPPAPSLIIRNRFPSGDTS